MDIGIVGCGVVGGACKFGFEKAGHSVFVHDTALGTSLEDLLHCCIVYVSVPTPKKEDGSCDTNVVESVVVGLRDVGYHGIVAIKSTITPGTTAKFAAAYPHFKDVCFIPEFLRERCAITDFIEKHQLLAIGSTSEETIRIVTECHGDYPESVIPMTATQAELLKYYHNTFNALRVVFANEFYEICSALGEGYGEIKKGLLKTSGVPDIYLDVNKNMRGYSSICWNKDVPALIQLSKALDIETPLIDMIPLANNNFEKTPFKGTREDY